MMGLHSAWQSGVPGPPTLWASLCVNVAGHLPCLGLFSPLQFGHSWTRYTQGLLQ